ncbi:hypothetical protein [Streptomyces rubellomurinus]|uniref:Uncharacterized protein n=2 Tax=Streptomyces TaxID=1883 RepID=A0A0F2TAU7_STRR3|nr:hypothetical protein [Streptomyces rubellomurinus]KJS56698.1 hypothetical protein VM98_05675 [Streptomyces rubellomurinus subsp. indigoferus]KJS60334.1 hypothetical protein VM95_21565 [Streptomyces rubellomurinus]
MARTLSGKRNPLGLALGVGQLLLAAPMLATLATGGLVIAVMGMAAGSSAVVAVPAALLMLLGPLLGLGLALLVTRVHDVPRHVVFPVISFGLLLGTAIEYVGIFQQ